MKKLNLTLMVVFMVLSLIGLQKVSACECNNGVGTPGYWKNHPEAWPVESLCIGSNSYPKAVAIALMGSPVAGDKTITMFKAFVAAYLNSKMGCCTPYNDFPEYNCIKEAYRWLSAFPVGSGVKANSEAWQHSHGEEIYFCLDDYNNGLYYCAPSRDSLE